MSHLGERRLNGSELRVNNSGKLCSRESCHSHILWYATSKLTQTVHCSDSKSVGKGIYSIKLDALPNKTVHSSRTIGKRHSCLHHELWVVQVEFLHCLAIAASTLHCIIHIIRTIEIGNTAATKTYQVFSHKVGVVVVVHHHLRHVVHTMRYTVVEDNGYTLFGKTAIGFDIMLIAANAHYESVDHKLLHHLQVLSLTVGVLVRLGYHHLLIVLVEYALYASHHLRGVWCVHLRHYHTDSVGATHFEIHSYRIASVAKTLRLAQHSLTCLTPYVLVVGQCT